MSRIITSKIEIFPGTVTLYDPIPMPAVLELEESNAAAQAFLAQYEKDDTFQTSELSDRQLPGICACVEGWNLTDKAGNELGDLRPDNFPGTPRVASAKLVGWLLSEIVKVYSGADIPNE